MRFRLCRRAAALHRPAQAREGIRRLREIERNLDTAGKPAHRDAQRRSRARQPFECGEAGCHDGRLQLLRRSRLESRRVGHEVRKSAGGSCEPRIPVELELNDLRLSGHGCPQGQCRTLPCNRDNSRARRRRGARCLVLCKSCSIFRTCRSVRACRIARRQQEQASQSPKGECT